MIQLQSISLRRGALVLLEQSSATIHPGQKVGLVGNNGCGKSSLLALLLGQLSADAGEVLLPGDWRISHMAQQITELDRPALDYVMDGDETLRAAQRALDQANEAGDGHAIARAHAQLELLDAYTAEARAGILLNGLGFAPHSHANPVGSFSGGWRIRLSLARALMKPSDLLLLDEPTNHLDMETLVWLEAWLKRYAGTLVIISHDRDFLDRVVGRILHMEGQQLHSYTGGYSNFERQRAERLALQQASHEKQQRQIAHMQRFVDRFRAKASKASQAQARLKAMERMEEIAPAHVDSPFEFVFPEPPLAADPLLHLDQVGLGYGELRVLDEISLSLAPGDRIGLLGLNGAGKSTLVRALAGALPPQSGTVTAARGLQVGYFAQHQIEQLDPEASPLLHLRRLSPDTPEQKLRDFLGGFDFAGDMATRNTAPFSGGEKARLALALLVWQAPNLLLLDEPTNHLDLNMRHALTVALQGFEGALVVVSHDRHLLRNTVDHFWHLAHGRLAPFAGDLEDYEHWLAEQGRTSPASADLSTRHANNDSPADHSAAGRRERRQLEARRRERLRPLQNRLTRLERELKAVTEALTEVEARLADNALYQAEQAAALKDVLATQARLRQQLDPLEEAWMEAAETLEQAQKQDQQQGQEQAD